MSISSICDRASTVSLGVNHRIPQITQNQANLFIHVGKETHIYRLPDDLAHADGFCDENFSVL
jgi:hypothetical protein